MRTRAIPRRGWLLLAALIVLAASATAATAAEQSNPAATKYTVVSTWGKSGTGDGQFSGATGLGVDGQGNVYVADGGNYRIQKFDAGGTFLTKWGSRGPGAGQFQVPSDVAVDPSGNVWVTDYGNYRLQRFTTTGGIPADGKASIIESGQGVQPDTVAVDATGNVFVTEFFNNRVRRYDAGSNWALGTAWGTLGTGAGQFNRPRGIATSPDGSIYVADRDNYRVQRFDATGKFLNGWGTSGVGPGQFRVARGAAVDLDCNVWIADSSARRLQKFSPAGKLLDQIPDIGSTDVAVGPTGDIYVLEGESVIPQVQRFREPTGPRPANAPGVLDLRYDTKTKTFLVSIPYTVSNVACPTSLAATASLKTAAGKALGTKTGLQLPINQRTTIDIPIAKAALLGAGFKTVGASKVAATQLSVVLKTNGRDTLTVKAGTLRISLAAIKSGALPGLTALIGR